MYLLHQIKRNSFKLNFNFLGITQYYFLWPDYNAANQQVNDATYIGVVWRIIRPGISIIIVPVTWSCRCGGTLGRGFPRWPTWVRRHVTVVFVQKYHCSFIVCMCCAVNIPTLSGWSVIADSQSSTLPLKTVRDVTWYKLSYPTHSFPFSWNFFWFLSSRCFCFSRSSCGCPFCSGLACCWPSCKPVSCSLHRCWLRCDVESTTIGTARISVQPCLLLTDLIRTFYTTPIGYDFTNCEFHSIEITCQNGQSSRCITAVTQINERFHALSVINTLYILAVVNKVKVSCFDISLTERALINRFVGRYTSICDGRQLRSRGSCCCRCRRALCRQFTCYSICAFCYCWGSIVCCAMLWKFIDFGALCSANEPNATTRACIDF